MLLLMLAIDGSVMIYNFRRRRSAYNKYLEEKLIEEEEENKQREMREADEKSEEGSDNNDSSHKINGRI